MSLKLIHLGEGEGVDLVGRRLGSRRWEVAQRRFSDRGRGTGRRKITSRWFGDWRNKFGGREVAGRDGRWFK